MPCASRNSEWIVCWLNTVDGYWEAFWGVYEGYVGVFVVSLQLRWVEKGVGSLVHKVYWKVLHKIFFKISSTGWRLFQIYCWWTVKFICRSVGNPWRFVSQLWKLPRITFGVSTMQWVYFQNWALAKSEIIKVGSKLGKRILKSQNYIRRLDNAI